MTDNTTTVYNILNKAQSLNNIQKCKDITDYNSLPLMDKIFFKNIIWPKLQELNETDESKLTKKISNAVEFLQDKNAIRILFNETNSDRFLKIIEVLNTIYNEEEMNLKINKNELIKTFLSMNADQLETIKLRPQKIHSFTKYQILNIAVDLKPIGKEESKTPKVDKFLEKLSKNISDMEKENYQHPNEIASMIDKSELTAIYKFIVNEIESYKKYTPQALENIEKLKQDEIKVFKKVFKKTIIVKFKKQKQKQKQQIFHLTRTTFITKDKDGELQLSFAANNKKAHKFDPSDVKTHKFQKNTKTKKYTGSFKRFRKNGMIIITNVNKIVSSYGMVKIRKCNSNKNSTHIKNLLKKEADISHCVYTKDAPIVQAKYLKSVNDEENYSKYGVLITESADCNAQEFIDDIENDKNTNTEEKLKQKKDLFKKMVKAVLYLHKNGFVHMDLKPGNFLIFKKENGEYDVKLCDLDGIRKNKNKITTYTLEYLSPKFITHKLSKATNDPKTKRIYQCLGKRIIDASYSECKSDITNEFNFKDDLWALGIIYYELLYGNDSAIIFSTNKEIMPIKGIITRDSLTLNKKRMGIIPKNPKTENNSNPEFVENIKRDKILENLLCPEASRYETIQLATYLGISMDSIPTISQEQIDVFDKIIGKATGTDIGTNKRTSIPKV